MSTQYHVLSSFFSRNRLGALLLCGACLLASACGNAKGTPRKAPGLLNAAMKAVHAYGIGHSGSLSPGNSKPTETEDVYGARISDLLVHEDFAQLEKIAEQNRTERLRLMGGLWKTYVFYSGFGGFYNRKESAEFFDQQIARAKKWVAAYPESATARLALAELYLSYAGFARGTGLANTVSESQWERFNALAADAKTVLLEASSLKDKDPNWYYEMQLVARDEGWDNASARELFDQATAFEPGYYHYYRTYAMYLLPRWYGEAGDVSALAEEVSKRVPEPQGSMLSFYTAGAVACYCQDDFQELRQISYPKAKEGYDNVVRLYGTTNLNANRFALMAAAFNDREAARDAFNAITEPNLDVWVKQEHYYSFRNWATTQ